jgi:transcriptional regulator with XRE-family HTH domain
MAITAGYVFTRYRWERNRLGLNQNEVVERVRRAGIVFDRKKLSQIERGRLNATTQERQALSVIYSTRPELLEMIIAVVDPPEDELAESSAGNAVVR